MAFWPPETISISHQGFICFLAVFSEELIEMIKAAVMKIVAITRKISTAAWDMRCRIKSVIAKHKKVAPARIRAGRGFGLQKNDEQLTAITISEMILVSFIQGSFLTAIFA